MDANGKLSRVGITMLITAFVLLRVWYAGMRELVPDEAVYWSWSRHLAGGYLDHPPMVAWLIHLSTRLFGSTEIGVRFPAVLCATGTLLVLLYMARQLRFDRGAYGWLLAIWLTSPLLVADGTLITPDSPSIFFSTCALACTLAIARKDDADDPQNPAWWLLFGACCGLAFLSKYTTVLLPGGVFLALLGSADGRHHLKKPWIYLSGMVATAVFLPVIYWNRAHEWASFRYQLNHGLNTSPPPIWRGLGDYLGGQAIVWTPVLFIAAIIVLLHFWHLTLKKRAPGERSALPLGQRLLLYSATLPLVFFGIAAARAHSEANWPTFAYFPLSLLMVEWLYPKDAAAASPKWRRDIIKIGCIVAAIGAIFMQAPELIWKVKPAHWQPRALVKLSEPFGWRRLAMQVSQSAMGLPIVCNRHQDAAEMAFYLPHQPDVWAVSNGSRPTAFDYFDNPPDYAKIPELMFIGYHEKQFSAAHGYKKVVVSGDEFVRLPDGSDRKLHWVILTH